MMVYLVGLYLWLWQLLFHMAPRMFKREIYSKKLMETQFWLQTTAVVLYFTSMWIAGITQGMMWRAVDEYGNLMYSFIDTVNVLHPYYTIRTVAGVMYLSRIHNVRIEYD